MLDKDFDIVYVAAPANQASGGPELLHQLVAALRQNGVKAYIYYYRRIPGRDPIHQEFAGYGNLYVDTIDDSPKNILIAPETQTDILDNYTWLKKTIWWMSVDFYYKSLGFSIKRHKMLKNKWLRYLLLLGKSSKTKRYFFFSKDGTESYVHFVQSEYARGHLLEKGIHSGSILFLSDYLNSSFISLSVQALKVEKKDIVAFNPKKGAEFTNKLRASMPDVEFVPIENMSRAQVIELLSTAKVYIDFGEHPGKDRIPREACILGACILTGRDGSAAYDVDVPIPSDYKYKRHPNSISEIDIKIRQCFADYHLLCKDFDDYREMIRNEEARFVRDVRQIFVNT
ncbi:hypothetical protein [Zhongshania aquimaris]|uniref:Glycosyltransferase family 1 protein n=1 Tax=Zhongshania aquimaris TaxID=2857107 RepID=A0ABS6VVB4_9GAMM|nr:hypothetical protein [Zhongshania aquimaris]MBW2942279.1 hypothetical protein [Zhongshania aquimaris]